jgi:hypothetical protein
MTIQDDLRPLIGRRALIGGVLAGAAGLVVVPQQASAGGNGKSDVGNAFAVLLKGRYQSVTQGPNLGLSTVDLSDGSFSTVPIYPANAIQGDVHEAIGNFYGQLGGALCAYDLPGGAMSMQFLPESSIIDVDDGQGGHSLQGTWELTILEATGAFRHFKGGHNHMLDDLHFLAPGDGSKGIDEYCVCFISKKSH